MYSMTITVSYRSFTALSPPVLGNHRSFHCSHSFVFSRMSGHGNPTAWLFFTSQHAFKVALCLFCGFSALINSLLYGCTSFPFSYRRTSWLLPRSGDHEYSCWDADFCVDGCSRGAWLVDCVSASKWPCRFAFLPAGNENSRGSTSSPSFGVGRVWDFLHSSRCAVLSRFSVQFPNDMMWASFHLLICCLYLL